MRPLRNRLKAVPDALTCPSAGAPKSAGGTASVTLSLPSTLKQSLLSDSDVEKARDKQDPNFVQQSLDVDWYRQNTGDLPDSKGCRLVFRQLFYTVPAKNKTTLTLLKGVTGRAAPGEMVALMVRNSELTPMFVLTVLLGCFWCGQEYIVGCPGRTKNDGRNQGRNSIQRRTKN